MPRAGTKKHHPEKKELAIPPLRVHDLSPGDQVMVVNARGEFGPFRIEECQPQSYIVILEGSGRQHADNLRRFVPGEIGGERTPEPAPTPKSKGANPESPSPESDPEPSPPVVVTELPKGILSDILSGVNLKDAVGTRWVSPDGTYSVIHLLKEKESADYFLVKLGDGIYRMTKLKREEETAYLVRVLVGEQKVRGCWCTGWRIRGECRHVLAIEKLLQQGRIS